MVRKNLSIEKGGSWLFERHPLLLLHHQRLESTGRKIVFEANERCNQENLIAQLKGASRARGCRWTPAQQLGLHGDGVVGVEPEGMERPCWCR